MVAIFPVMVPLKILSRFRQRDILFNERKRYVQEFKKPDSTLTQRRIHITLFGGRGKREKEEYEKAGKKGEFQLQIKTLMNFSRFFIIE